MMLFYDIMIVCSIILAGKTTAHVQMNCQQLSAYLPPSMPTNHLNRKYEMLSFCFQTRFHACDIYIPYIEGPCMD